MHLDLHRLIKTLNASSYPALVWKLFLHNAYDISSSSRLTPLRLPIFRTFSNVGAVRPRWAIRWVIFDGKKFFFSPSWATDYFHRRYLRTALAEDVQSNILHDRLFSDHPYKNSSLHPSSQIFSSEIAEWWGKRLCYIYQWNRVLDRICHTNLASTWSAVTHDTFAYIPIHDMISLLYK